MVLFLGRGTDRELERPGDGVYEVDRACECRELAMIQKMSEDVCGRCDAQEE
jgi:hypothetical protein